MSSKVQKKREPLTDSESRIAASSQKNSGFAAKKRTGRSGAGKKSAAKSQSKGKGAKGKNVESASKKADTKSRRTEQSSAGIPMADEIWMITSIGLMVLLLLSNFGLCGTAGHWISSFFFGIFGIAQYVMPAAFCLGVLLLLANDFSDLAVRKSVAGFVILMCISSYAQIIYIYTKEDIILSELFGFSVSHHFTGGIIGGGIAVFLNRCFGLAGTIVILTCIFLLSLVLLTQRSFAGFFRENASRVTAWAAQRKEQHVKAAKKRREEKEAKKAAAEEQIHSAADGEEDIPATSGFFVKMKSGRKKTGVSRRQRRRQCEEKVREMEERKDTSKQGMQRGRIQKESSLMNVPVFTASDEVKRKDAVRELHPEIYPFTAEDGKTEPFEGTLDYSAFAFSSEKTGQDFEKEIHDTTKTLEEQRRERESYLPPYEARGTFAAAELTMEEEAEVVEVIRNTNSATGQYGQMEETPQIRIHMEGSDMEKDPVAKTQEPDEEQISYVTEDADEEQISCVTEDADEERILPVTEDADEEQMSYVTEDAEESRIIEAAEFPEEEEADPREALRAVHQPVSAKSATSKDRSSADRTAAKPPAPEKVSQPEVSRTERTEPKASLPKVPRTEGTEPKASLPAEYVAPPLSLLDSEKQEFSPDYEDSLRETAELLQSTLASFGVNVTITDISCGPTVTRYEMFPEQGTKVSKIVSLTDDIKLNLAAADIRIEAPIPGKAAIGIEVPNKHNMTVHFREVIDNPTFRKFKSKLAFAVGKDIGGKTVVTDLAKMPHLLIAGATGSGKSVCINTLIMSILYKASPEEVKMIMIDPKMVELSVYRDIPHLLVPVVTDPKKASNALNWAVETMTNRYKDFAACGVRNIQGYNKKVDEIIAAGGDPDNMEFKRMPQIVIIIDELADLMMVAPGEVEDAIVRLSQLARAAGIHLVIATQRPSVNVITGLIKANVPSRIAFSVSSGVDSRTIIDMNGAEKLLGKGDMLFYPAGYQKPVRVQGAFVSDAEINDVVDFIREKNQAAVSDKSVQESIEKSMSTASGSAERDDYFESAARLVVDKEKATIGMLQRKFKIGFNRAARIIDQLHDAGIVGPEEGTRPRKVLMDESELETYFEEYL